MQTMKAKIRRVLAWVLSVAMILPSFPMTAFAAEEQVDEKATGSVVMQVNDSEQSDTEVATGSVIKLKSLNLEVDNNGKLKATGTTGASISFSWKVSGNAIKVESGSAIKVQVATENAIYLVGQDDKLTSDLLSKKSFEDVKATVDKDAEAGSAQLVVTVQDGDKSATITSDTYTVKPVIKSIKAAVKADVAQPVATGTAVSDYITVTAIYSNNSEKEVAIADYTVDPAKVVEGTKTYTVTLKADTKISTTVDLKGKTPEPGVEAKIESIEAVIKDSVEQPIATGTAVSDCIIVTATYSDKVKTEVAATDYTVEPKEVVEGTKTYTVTLKADAKISTTVDLEGKTAEPLPEEVALTEIKAEYKGEEVAVGEEIDKEDIAVTAVYSNKETKKVTDFTISPERVTKAGENEIKVSYEEKNVTKTATVIVVGFEKAEVPDEVFGNELKGLSVKNVTENAGGKITDVIGYKDGDVKNGATDVKLELLVAGVNAEDQKDITYKFFANDRELTVTATGAAVASGENLKVPFTVSGKNLKAGNNTITVSASKGGETVNGAANIEVYEPIGLSIKNPLSEAGKILVKEKTGSVKLLPLSANYKKGYKVTAEVISGAGAENKNGSVSINVKKVAAGTEVKVELTATLYDTSKKGVTTKLVEETVPVTILVQSAADFLTIKSVAIVDEKAAAVVDKKAEYNKAVKDFKKALTELTLEEGKNTIQLVALTNPASGASVYAPVWASSNEKIATVDESGKLTLHRTGGKVTISCTVGPKTAKLSFATAEDKAKAVSAIKVNMASKTSGNLDLYSQNYIEDIVRCIDFTYGTGKDKKVKCISGSAIEGLEFTSSNSEVASVEGALIKANKVGSAKISVYAPDSAKKVGTFNVKVVVPQYATVNGTISQTVKKASTAYGAFRAYQDYNGVLKAYVELDETKLPENKKWSFKLENLVGYYTTADENPELLNKSYTLNLSKIKENTETAYKVKLPNKQEMILNVRVNSLKTVSFAEMDGVLYAGTSGTAIAYFDIANDVTVTGVSAAAVVKKANVEVKTPEFGSEQGYVAVKVSPETLEKPGTYTTTFTFTYEDGTQGTAVVKLKVVALPTSAKFNGVIQTYKNPSTYGYLEATNISEPAVVTFDKAVYAIKDFEVLGQKLYVGFILYEDGAIDYVGVVSESADGKLGKVKDLTQKEINSLANKKLVFTEVEYYINGVKAAKPVNITATFAPLPVVKLVGNSINMTMPINSNRASAVITITSSQSLASGGINYLPGLLNGNDASAKLIEGTDMEIVNGSYNAKKKVYEYEVILSVTRDLKEGAVKNDKRTLDARKYSVMLQDKANQAEINEAWYLVTPKITITYEKGHEA